MWAAILGLVIATLILSLKTGCILGASWFKVKQLIGVSLAISISLFLLVMIFIPYQAIFVRLLDEYTFAGSMSLALLLIYLGSRNEEEIVTLADSQKRWAKYLPVFIPCPLCLVALALTIILLVPILKVSPVKLGFFISGLFWGLLIIIALSFRKIIEAYDIKPLSVLNPILLFFGVITLICGLFIPSFVQAMALPFSPFALTSVTMTVASVIGMALVVSIGYFKYHIN